MPSWLWMGLGFGAVLVLTGLLSRWLARRAQRRWEWEWNDREYQRHLIQEHERCGPHWYDEDKHFDLAGERRWRWDGSARTW